MRILITTSTFPTQVDDGVPRFVFDLAQALAKSAKVEVLAPAAPGAASYEVRGGVPIHRFTYFWPRRSQRLAPGIRDNLRTSWLARLQVPFFFLFQWLAMRRLVRRFKPDVVNAHWLVPQGLVAAVAKGKRSPMKLVLHVHAGDVDLLRNVAPGPRIARFVLGRSAVVFAASRQVRSRLDAIAGYSTGAYSRPMGVDLDLFAAPRLSGQLPASPFPGGFILFVGRLVEKKGLHYLLHAMPSVVAEHPDVGLVVIGSGPEESTLRGETASLSISHRVIFLGSRSHADVARYLQACRAFAVPSIVDSRGETEGMPTVIVEAMAAGAAIVATSVAGIPEVLQDGVTAWLCTEKDAAGLATSLNEALTHGHDSPIRLQAAKEADRYRWDEVGRDYLTRIEAG